MNLIYKENVIPKLQDLIKLYNNVGWLNYTNHTNMLKAAYDNSLLVITAWEDDKLIGAIRIVGDGCSIIYVQDILVLNEYQHMGIGSNLFIQAMDKYKDVYQKVLLTDNNPKTKGFYEKMGMDTSESCGCVSFVKFS